MIILDSYHIEHKEKDSQPFHVVNSKGVIEYFARTLQEANEKISDYSEKYKSLLA